MNILTISGSQRTGSFNSMLVQALPELAEGHSCTMMDYSAIPVFSQDLEAQFPESVTALKNQIRQADAIIISTPEYNRSIPGPLKNLMDWTSRPYGDSAWAGKEVLVMGVSIGPIGTALAQADLRKVLLYLDARVHGQPETYIGNAQDKFSTEGTLTDDSTRDHLAKALATFTAAVAG